MGLMAWIGAGELWPLLVVGLLLFGAGRLPSLARSVGEAARELRRSAREVTGDLDDVRMEIQDVTQEAKSVLPGKRLVRNR